MEDDELAVHVLLRMMMRKCMNLVGLCKGKSFGRTMHCGGHWKDQQPGEDLVLDHIILDLTGDSVPLEHITDVSVQKAFRKKRRLLRHSNTVLFSRLGIMALVAIMLVVTTLLTWYFTSTYSARSVKSLATILRDQLLRNSVQSMLSVLGDVYNATLVLSSLHQQVYLASANPLWASVELELRQVNRGVFNAQTQYSSVAFVSKDGLVTDYSRASSGAEYFFFVNSTSSTKVWYVQNLTGIVGEEQAPPPSIRNPPYPLGAENVLNHNVPLQVYWTIAPNILGEAVVSPAVPAIDIETSAFLGLATITSTFKYVNTYLASVDLLGGLLYFEWNNALGESSIVAFSYNGTGDILTSPKNASNPIVRAAAEFLASSYEYDITSQYQTHAENVELVGNKYYIDTMPLLQPPFRDLNLTAIMIVPRYSIMGQIDQRSRTVIHVSVGTAVGVLVLGCCFICFLTSKMSTEMRLRQELIRLLVGKHRAEQSSNYKSQFLANMSHELRTPMAGIIGLLDLLSCDSLTSEQEFSVSQIRRCATGLLALVNNVLDISKLYFTGFINPSAHIQVALFPEHLHDLASRQVEAGRMELEVAPFSLADELESLVDMFAAQCLGSNIDVVLDLSDNIPPILRGDSARIRQIVSNLLSNSVKFTTQGHVLVRGWVDQSLLQPNGKPPDFSLSMLSRRDRVSGPIFVGAENQVALVFEVDDTGCGIPVDMRETVFDSFVQGDSSTTRTHGGSGLGLYIVRSLVELMGGEVAVVPSEGSGTRMRFHIFVERESNLALGGTVSCEAPALNSPSDRDGLNSLLGSPSNVSEPVKLPLPKVLAKAQVLVAMQEGAARKVTVQWLERIGLKVTCVKVWEDIIPTFENISRNSPTGWKVDVGKDDGGGGELASLTTLNCDQSPESSSQVSESILDSVSFPSVLALVDLTMHSRKKVGDDSNFVDNIVLGSKDDPEKLPSYMKDILECMLRVQRHHAVAVGWIVAPDCGARWRQALEADGCFFVMNKPLHGSRMRRLLSLLFRTGKLEPHRLEVHNCEASNPLTPSLRTMGVPLSEQGVLASHTVGWKEPSRQNAWTPSDTSIYNVPQSTDKEMLYYMTESFMRDADAPGALLDLKELSMKAPYSSESSILLVNRKDKVFKSDSEISSQAMLADSSENSRKIGLDGTDIPYLPPTTIDATPSPNYAFNELQRFQNVLLVDIPRGMDENQRLLSTSSPPSPTSGLIAPKGAVRGWITSERVDSYSDCIQDIRRNGIQLRGFEGDWNGPVIDSSLPRKSEQNQSLVSGQQATLAESKHGSQPNLRKAAVIPTVLVTAEQLSTLPDKNGIPHSSPENVASVPVSITGVSNSASAYGNKALSSIHILLVEDTPVLQRLASMMLKKLGASVTVVGDGQQAVFAVAETVEATQVVTASSLRSDPNFDLILMDCAMPVMDGYSATKAIRAAEENTNRHIPIVALTAHALASDEERCLSVGMDAYLTKPINCKLMVTTIQDLVSRGRA